MRFKDLLGRKPDESTGRLIDSSVSARDHSGGLRRDLDDQLSPRLRRSADAAAEAEAEAASGRGVGPVAPVPRTAPIAPDAPIAPAAPASLADLFARLLAAEQGEPAPLPSNAPIRLSEADVERLAAGVAARFANGPLRDEVRQIVVEVSERLVREEIARIRQTAESQQP